MEVHGNATGQRHPLAGSLLAFCLLPSLTLHVSHADLRPPISIQTSGDQLPALHRMWSTEIIEKCGMEAVTAFDDPVLPLAMLPTEKLDRFVPLAGATLAGQRIRRCIAREDVDQLRAQLGDVMLDFVRRRAPALHAGLDDSSITNWSLDAAGEQIARLGNALLAQVFNSASKPVAQRALLRLPAEAFGRTGTFPVAADDALHLSLNLLQELDPEWLSSFPVTL